MKLNRLSNLQRFSLDKPSGSEGRSDDGSTGQKNSNRSPRGSRRLLSSYLVMENIGLFLGPVLFVLLMQVPLTGSFTSPMRAVAASTTWMGAWWVTEAVPIPVTSLLPLLLFPLTGALSFSSTASSYADPNIFLFMGGFMLATAIQKWNLHQRIALLIVNLVGTRPEMLLLGFMVATGFLSMWISNTATAMMMLPIGLAVTAKLAELAEKEGIDMALTPQKFGYGQALMLGIAYSASIGGVATLIGTPPNAIFAGAVRAIYDIEITFAGWMLYGLPFSIIFMAVTWLMLSRIKPVKELQHLKGGREVVREELRRMGPISGPEIRVMVVFALVVTLWITRSFLLGDLLPDLNDAIIALGGAMLLFIIPVDLRQGQFLLDWDTAVRIPWGILILFGGGIAIAAGFTASELALWMGAQLEVLKGAPMVLVFLAVVTMVIFLTEVTSNTGTTSVMMPVMAALAVAMAVHPLGLMVTAATAASFAFMLPVATPPNAVVFASGYLTIPQMARVGFRLNVLGIIIITVITYFWVPIAWSGLMELLPPQF